VRSRDAGTGRRRQLRFPERISPLRNNHPIPISSRFFLRDNGSVIRFNDRLCSMKRFILTGAPGAGKTAILRQLELDGFAVVEEAATDIIALWQAQGIAEPWTRHSFLDAIAELQMQRRVRADCEQNELQFHDRSPVCTAALAKYLGYPVTFSRGNWSASAREASFRNRFSSFRTSASSLPPKHGESVLTNLCVLSEFTKRPIAVSDLRSSPLLPETCAIG